VGGLSIVTRSLLARSAVVAFATTDKGLLRSVPELAACLQEAAVSVVSLVPAVLDALLELQPSWTPHACLRAVLLGGAATPLPLLRRAQTQRVPVLTTYGLTETCSQVTTTPLGEQPRVRGVHVSAGRALPGIELSLDASRRVRVRGSVLCSGYLGEASPLQPDQWLVTDDRGELDGEGNLFLFGRITECIITGGENVDPQRVEAVLSNVPGVRAACVVGIDDARFGQVVACALVAEPMLTLPELTAQAATELARHELPRQFLQLESLPRLSNGKTDRSQVKALFTASSTDTKSA
jgi:O-succinylbenzoic acid--CoA ligase